MYTCSSPTFARTQLHCQLRVECPRTVETIQSLLDDDDDDSLIVCDPIGS